MCGFPGKQGKRDRKTDRQKDRQTERDGPEFKGPPDAIAKPSDQKTKYVFYSNYSNEAPYSSIDHAQKHSSFYFMKHFFGQKLHLTQTIQMASHTAQ